MKIVYFGSSSPLSLTPLITLIQSHHTLCAIVINDDINSDFNVISPNTIKSIAFNNSIPVLNYNIQGTELDNQVAAIQADLIFVSCFTRRIPKSILAEAKYGGVNLHPSELPLYRGPVPLFWQFRDGISEFGISLHRISDELDAGNIIAQKHIQLMDGISIQSATQQIADESCGLVISALEELEENTICEVKQNQAIVTYQSFPTSVDYTVSTKWTAKRIYNFINAYKAENITFLCNLSGKDVLLTNAKSYRAVPYPGMNGKEVSYKDTSVFFTCAEGFIECEYKG